MTTEKPNTPATTNTPPSAASRIHGVRRCGAARNIEAISRSPAAGGNYVIGLAGQDGRSAINDARFLLASTRE